MMVLFYGQTLLILINIERFLIHSKVSNVLDISVISHQNGRFETDIVYREADFNSYLNFSHHSEHATQNIPKNFPQGIIVFAFDEARMNERLCELKTLFLLYSNCPLTII